MFLAEVTKNQIRVTQTEPITSGSVNAYLVKFEFSDEWQDLNRIAVFKAEGETYNVWLDDSNMCFIPWEVMQEYGPAISFGAYGTRGDEIVLPTIWAKTAAILEGVTTGLPQNTPQQTLLNQVLERLSLLEYLINTGGLGGVTEEQYQDVLNRLQELTEDNQDIRDKIAEMEESARNYDVDETLIVTDGVLGVKTPTIPITQKEYDALPPSQKVGIVYLITDAEGASGGGGSSSPPSTSAPYEGITFTPGTGLGYDDNSNELYVSMVENLDDPDLDRPVSGTLVKSILGDLEDILKTI